MSTPIERPTSQPVLITGGAGFIGTNLAHRLLAPGRACGCSTTSRAPASSSNLDWLRETHGDRVEVEVGDIRDARRGRAGRCAGVGRSSTSPRRWR